MRVLWLTPDKPEDVSVGRRRIAERLERDGFDVTLRGTTPRTALRSLRECAAGRYDAVVGTTRAGAFVAAAAKLLGTPLVLRYEPVRVHGFALVTAGGYGGERFRTAIPSCRSTAD